MKPDWILIANAAHARLLRPETGCPMVVLHAFEHPQSRLKSSELDYTFVDSQPALNKLHL